MRITTSTQRRATPWSITWLALTLAACGGGGGGGGGGAAEQVSTDSGPTLAITKDNMWLVAQQGVGQTEAVLLLGQLAVDELRRVAQSGRLHLQLDCGNGGTADYSVSDPDGSGTLTRGDSVQVRYQDCGRPQLGRPLNGTVTVNLDTLTDAARGLATGSLDLGEGLTWVVQTYPPYPLPSVTHRLAGTLRFAHSGDDFTDTLSVSAGPADDLRMGATDNGSGASVMDHVYRPSLTRKLNYETVRAELTGSLTYANDLRKGTYDVVVTQPLLAYLDTYPDQGRIDIVGAGGSRVTVTPDLFTTGEIAGLALDSKGNGTVDLGITMPWWPVIEGYLWSDAASGWHDKLRAYAANDFRVVTLPGDFNLSKVAVADTLVVQLSRQPRADTALTYRLTDVGSYIDHLGPEADVPIDVQARGGRTLIRPRQPLAYGHSYTLRATAVGQPTVDGGTLVTDTLGNQLALQHQGSVASFQTSDVLWIALTGTGGPGLLATGTLATVSASAPRNPGTVSFHWAQLDGPALQIDTPDSASTTVHLVGGVPGGTGLATLQVTATDSTGQSTAVTGTLRTLDLASLGEHSWLLYTRSQAGDVVGGGLTQLYTDADSRFLSSTNGNAIGFAMFHESPYAGLPLTVSSPYGLPLEVRSYTGAQKFQPPYSGSAGLAFDASACASVSGNFQILEFSADSSGQLLSLALDFEQHCNGASAALFGSVRHNSTVPIRP